MTGSPDFDWYSDDAEHCIVVRHQPAIAVYLNPHDEVVIRQQDQYGDEDDWIYLTKDNARTVAQAIIDLTGDVEVDRPHLMLPKPDPLTGAERQRQYRNKHRNENGDAHTTESDELPLHPVTNGHQQELVS